MTIFVFHVDPHISDIGYMKVCGGHKPWEVSHLFSHEISRRMPSESCLGTPWGPSYEHICKNLNFCEGKFQARYPIVGDTPLHVI